MAMARHVSAAENLRGFLKRETAAKHDYLDSIFAGFELETLAGYAGFLSAHYIAWNAMSDAWSAALRDLIGFEAPDYAAMLRDDLRDVGVADLADLPNLTVRPCESQAGLAYVLAGSRLGIGAIARQPNWGGRNDTGHRFLTDPQGANIFRTLIARFDRSDDGEFDPQLALEAANACFDAFVSAAQSVHGRLQ